MKPGSCMSGSSKDDDDAAAITALRDTSRLFDVRAGMTVSNGDRVQYPGNPTAYWLRCSAGR